MPRLMTILVFMLATCASGSAFAQQCLHGSTETTEQATRRKEALRATRTVNNLQANQPGARTGKYFSQIELPTSPFATRSPNTGSYIKSLNFTPGEELFAGWQLTLSVVPEGYWFMVKDKTDPCGFAYISNQDGVIYNSEPIRPGQEPAAISNRD